MSFFKISGGKRLERCAKFPAAFSSSASGYSAVIGLGGNIGDVKARFKKLLRLWQDDPRISLLASSPLFINAAFGYTKQADFTNAVVLLKTGLSANGLLRLCLWYERRFKRVRSFKNAPRTLDLDIIFYSGRSRTSARLEIPHKGAFNRASVYLPLGLI